MNKYFNIAIVTALSVAITSFKGNAMSDLSQYVDPFIGVDGGGNVFPGPCVPFGMVKVGPDCGGKDWMLVGIAMGIYMGSVMSM